MTAIKATVKGGRLELETPADWPEGTEVVIEPLTRPLEKLGLDESEWRDDPAALADWSAWIKTLTPLEFTAEETARMAEFDEQMRHYNLEAVRRQMGEGHRG